MGDPASTHILAGLDWLVKLGIGLIVASAGILLIRPARPGALRFALGIFTIEAGTWSRFEGSLPAADRPGGNRLINLCLAGVGIFLLRTRHVHSVAMQEAA